jgi:type IV pilus assembly protein PilM
MAKANHVWGIDIGQCALKALRCQVDGDGIVADAFDFIEYPKILSQPEADPEELVREALEQFLSRNDMRRCRVAMSVPGQSGLAKFFKPPPVAVKRIPDIVRYEARQQIPFPIEEVVWDFQKMAGGQEVDGFAVDSEVGLFAMKRDQVYRALAPFKDQGVEVDTIQLAPLSIYNFITYDLLTDLPDPDLYDADDPPASIVVMSMGTDATDLVITNGFRVWQRSIPLGGNHFTKQLTKEMKLTFAKAEHLKRNARQAEDPKTVFQAMRPIFNDVVTEVQRSVGYFQGIDRNAKIRGVVLLGNTVKLPGLQQYVAKNLGYEVIPFDSFSRLNGPSVVSAPAFVDNQLAFGVCYGLCIQRLQLGQLDTNLLPPEIKTQRMIRAKKPWAVASVGALMLAFAFNFLFNYNVWSEVKQDNESGGVTWKSTEDQVVVIQGKSFLYTGGYNNSVSSLEFLKEIGEEVVGAGDRRLLWLELLRAVDEALPWTPDLDPRTFVDFKEKPLGQRLELHIEHVESQYFPDLKTGWYKPTVKLRHDNLIRHLTRNDPQPVVEEEPVTPAVLGEKEKEEGPTGPGWVIELKGFHYYQAPGQSGADHVRDTLLAKLENGKVNLPADDSGGLEMFTMKELGITSPILSEDSAKWTAVQVDNPEYRAGDAVSEDNPPRFDVARYDFSVQFCWQGKPLGQRLKDRREKAEEEDQEQQTNANTETTN